MTGQDETPVILNAQGHPVSARAARQAPRACPRCRGTKRVASGGFGTPHPVCGVCGFEWHGEAFVPAEESN